MTTQHSDQDTLREQVRARYAAALQVTGDPGGCGSPDDAAAGSARRPRR